MQPDMTRGQIKQECNKDIDFAKRFSVDIGQQYMLDYVIEHNASGLYNNLKGK